MPHSSPRPLVRLGNSDLLVSPVALGLWPIAGMTTLAANETDSLATIRAALDSGINFFDTAHCYGADGISERLLGRVAAEHRDAMVIATKGGVHWADDGSRVGDASPGRLRQECEESLRRMKIGTIDLLYLHGADGRTPIEESAGALLELKLKGWVRGIGASNLKMDELQRFHAVCPIIAAQYRYNLLQRDLDQEIGPWCRGQGIPLVTYWPLMKGLLAGKIRRDWVFDPGDKRLQYPMFRPPEWEWNQCLLDQLERIAADEGITVAGLVTAWTIQRPGIGSVLCGAKRDWQIRETAQAMQHQLSPECLAAIGKAVLEREACSTAGGTV